VGRRPRSGQVVAQSDRRARGPVPRGVGEHGRGAAVEVPQIACSRSPGRSRPALQASAEEGSVSKAKTNKAMDPAAGPATPAEGRARLERAHESFDQACRQLVSRGEYMRTTIFGTVPVEDYIRFMELHTRHHGKQIGSGQ
jgi:DinB superfamily